MKVVLSNKVAIFMRRISGNWIELVFDLRLEGLHLRDNFIIFFRWSKNEFVKVVVKVYVSHLPDRCIKVHMISKTNIQKPIYFHYSVNVSS